MKLETKFRCNIYIEHENKIIIFKEGFKEYFIIVG